MAVYYNEIDPYAAQWLRNLVSAGHLPHGYVDTRSIVEVRASDLEGFTQCHFFAGIGGWSYALKLAHWSAERPCWTGSAPCQPLSQAGQQRGHADSRHVWPAFYNLIAECRPATVFGEQVASSLGREWLAGVRADLEAIGYACGCADLCAAGVGAPHIRQRLYWVADAGCERDEPGGEPGELEGESGDTEADLSQRQWGWDADCDRGAAGGLEHAEGVGHAFGQDIERGGEPGQRERDLWGQFVGPGDAGGLGDPTGAGLEGWAGQRCDVREERAPAERAGDEAGGLANSLPTGWPAWGATSGNRSSTWISCLDGKERRVKPGIFPLADGLPLAVDGAGSVSRSGALRGAGNAIVPPLAAEFVRAWMLT